MEELICELYYRYVGWNNVARYVSLNGKHTSFRKEYNDFNKNHGISLYNPTGAILFRLDSGWGYSSYMDTMSSSEIRNQMFIDYRNLDRIQFNLIYKGSLGLQYNQTLKDFLDLNLEEE